MSDKEVQRDQNRFFQSLAFKLSLSIFVIASTLLSSLGIYYIHKFEDIIDEQLVSKAQVPVKLIRNNDLPIEVLRDKKAISKFIEGKVISSTITTTNNLVVYSSEPGEEGLQSDIHAVYTNHADVQMTGRGVSSVYKRVDGIQRVLISGPIKSRDGEPCIGI